MKISKSFTVDATWTEDRGLAREIARNAKLVKSMKVGDLFQITRIKIRPGFRKNSRGLNYKIVDVTFEKTVDVVLCDRHGRIL